MTTNINITVGGNSLIDQAKAQQQAARTAKFLKDNQTRVEAEAKTKRDAELARQGLAPNGQPINGTVPAPRFRPDEPAANRFSKGEVFWLPTAPVPSSDYALPDTWVNMWTTPTVDPAPPRGWWIPARQKGIRPKIAMAESPNDHQTWFMSSGDYSQVDSTLPYITFSDTYGDNTFKANSELLNQLIAAGGTTATAIFYRDTFIAGTINKPAGLRSIKISFNILFDKSSFTGSQDFNSSAGFSVLIAGAMALGETEQTSGISLSAGQVSTSGLLGSVRFDGNIAVSSLDLISYIFEPNVEYIVEGILYRDSSREVTITNTSTSEKSKYVFEVDPVKISFISSIADLFNYQKHDITVRWDSDMERPGGVGGLTWPQVPSSIYVKNLLVSFG